MTLSPRSPIRLTVLAVVGIAAVEFPYAVDGPISAQEMEESREYYARVYAQLKPEEQPSTSEQETKYLQYATAVAEAQHIKEQVSTTPGGATARPRR